MVSDAWTPENFVTLFRGDTVILDDVSWRMGAGEPDANVSRHDV
jgi:hypothetical protein